MIKFIDAKQNLSVQVHPDDTYALLNEGESGKTEMWYVMDAQPDSKLIYGFNKKISHQEFEKRITDNTLLEVCNQVPIKKGDVFFIEAGTLHAIGAGALIAEIQQSSNSTYRVYDYGRLGKDGKPRQLHIEKALADKEKIDSMSAEANNIQAEINKLEAEMKQMGVKVATCPRCGETVIMGE